MSKKTSKYVMTEREKEVLESFCLLSGLVMKEVFNYEQAADCICSNRQRHPLANFEFSQGIIDYIRNATIERMQKDGKI